MSKHELWREPRDTSQREDFISLTTAAIEWGQANPDVGFNISPDEETYKTIYIEYESLEDLRNQEEVLSDKLNTLRKKIIDYDAS